MDSDRISGQSDHIETVGFDENFLNFVQLILKL